MELLSAHYEPRTGRFVVGAQDNCAQVLPEHARPTDAAVGFVEGDGTVTLVDNVANPARLYGTTQFLGVGTIERDPSDSKKAAKDSDGYEDEDDDDCGGLCYAEGDKFVNIPIDKYFPEPSSFPFFVQQYQLNSQEPTELVFWVNGTASRESGFYSFSIPYGSRTISPPKLIIRTPPEAYILDFVRGGFTQGHADPSLLVGVSTTNIYISRNGSTTFQVMPLPRKFATPVTLEYDEADAGARILGPLTHGRTINLAVAASNSDVVAVTGWQSIDSNNGDENIFYSSDCGKNWIDVTGNLRQVSGVVGKIRPGGMVFVDLVENKDRALLVSAANGVYVSFLGAVGDGARTATWSRFGNLEEFPIVLNADLSYEHYSDSLVAATFGRGIYIVHDAKEALLKVRANLGISEKTVPESSSAAYFPKPL